MTQQQRKMLQKYNKLATSIDATNKVAQDWYEEKWTKMKLAIMDTFDNVDDVPVTIVQDVLIDIAIQLQDDTDSDTTMVDQIYPK